MTRTPRPRGQPNRLPSSDGGVYLGAVAIHPPQIPGLTDWRPLARGGFAIVWEARQKSLDRLVAVKVDQRRLDVESERQRFLREAGAAGRMSSHPGIVTVHDAGILDDDRPYLVMDLCPGGSLTRYLRADQRLGPQRVREIGFWIADALVATHERGVLHRDVKPANILVDAYGNVGLADFGLAALPGPRTPPQESFQALTPAYTAPEILHRRPPGPTGDVYSLAATMYALLSGRAPRWPESGGTPSLREVLELHQNPVEPVPGVPPALMEILLPALALDPASRPDATAFRDQLAALRLTGPGTGGQADGGAADRGAVGGGVDGGAVGGAAGLDGGAGAAGAGVRTAALRVTGARSAPLRRPLVLALVALVLVACLVGALALLGRDRQPVAAPAASTAAASPSSASGPTGASSQATPAPDQTPAVLPDGFQDCPEGLGRGAFCRTFPECWAGVISVLDTPSIATPQNCDQTHVYQTFVAGELGDDVRQQSQLEAKRAVRTQCGRSTLRAVLRAEDRSADWEILAIPPQADDGQARIYRCIFGLGERSSAVPLVLPR